MPLIEYATQITRRLAGEPLDPYEYEQRTRLLAVSSIGATALTVDGWPSGLAAGAWLVVDPYTAECELRRVTSVSGTTVAFAEALVYAHAENDAVLVSLEPQINVLWFGAIGDNSNNDTTALQAAVAAAKAVSTSTFFATLYFPPGYRFRCSTTLEIGAYVNLWMESELIHTGTAAAAAIVIGAADLQAALMQYRVWVRRNTYSDWSSDDTIGVKVINARLCQIDAFRARGFTIGVQLQSNLLGCVYNTIQVGSLIDNCYGIDLQSVTDLGWVNENLFIGGQISVTTAGHSAAGGDQDCAGIRIGASAVYNENNNVFLKPSIELNAAHTTGLCVPIHVVRGGYNHFYNVRSENNDLYAMKVENTSWGNVAEMGYGYYADPLIDTSDGASNSVLSNYLSRIAPAAVPIFDSGPIHRNACYYDGSTTVHVPRMHVVGSGAASTFSNLSNLTLAANYLEYSTSRGLGVWVDTTTVKRFCVLADVDAGYTGILRVIAYDSGGSVLTGVSPYYVKGSTTGEVTNTTTFGGHYYFAGTLATEKIFEVHADVKKVQVIIAGSVRIRRMQIFGLHASSAGRQRTTPAWVEYQEAPGQGNIGSAAPSAGTWVAGRRVYNAAPAAGGTEGWVCTVGGTPGTWKAFGAIAP